ncbi:MAG: hypothetical protein K8J08_12620 [Thermoanaerobaculia bacterium]|nr:hypothetical protein [Thermoanaerobaculia bacterium]
MMLRKLPVWVATLVLGTLVGCQGEPILPPGDSALPPLVTASSQLEVLSAEALAAIGVARSKVFEDPTSAEAALLEAEAAIRKLHTQQLPLLRTTERCEAALRHARLGKLEDARKELTAAEEQLRTVEDPAVRKLIDQVALAQTAIEVEGADAVAVLDKLLNSMTATEARSGLVFAE